jgi:hypothetical protein
MSMLIGIFLCTFGIAGIVFSARNGLPVLLILSVIMLLGGAVVTYFAYKKGQSDKTAHIALNRKRQCPVCHINLADECQRCPRCGTEL